MPKPQQAIDAIKLQTLNNLIARAKSGKKLSPSDLKVLNQLKEEFDISDRKEKRFLRTIKEVAAHYKRTPRWVSYMKGRGMPAGTEEGYDLDKIDAWLKEREEKGVGKKKKYENPKKTYWDTIWREWKAKTAELEYLQKKGELISESEVVEEWAARIIEIKTGLMAFRKKLPPILEGKTAREISSILYDEVWDLLDQYSRRGRYTPKAKTKKKGDIKRSKNK